MMDKPLVHASRPDPSRKTWCGAVKKYTKRDTVVVADSVFGLTGGRECRKCWLAIQRNLDKFNAANR